MSSPSIEFYNQALDAIQAGQFPEALKAAENSLTEDPKDGQTWQLYAVILNALGRAEDAAKAMAKVQEIGLDPLDELIMKAADAAAAGKAGAAITHYEDALELDDSRFEIYVSYALVLLEEGYAKDALEASAKALELNEDDPSAWYARGRILRKTNQNEAALEALTKSTDLDPNLLVAVYERGVVLAATGELAEALKCFEKVLSVNPTDPSAIEAKAAMLQALNQG